MFLEKTYCDNVNYIKKAFCVVFSTDLNPNIDARSPSETAVIFCLQTFHMELLILEETSLMVSCLLLTNSD